jgi:tRNA-dihydrouridine synthase B
VIPDPSRAAGTPFNEPAAATAGTVAAGSPVAAFDALRLGSHPFLALAPMQDVTDLPFWRLLARYGGPDVYWTEYSRVHVTSTLERGIREAVLENPTGRPAIAQLIGNDVPSLVRAARQLQELPVAAVDLNLGCPAPVVYRKCAGGGLLREPQRVDAILGALRDTLTRVRFTVKTRLGFDDPAAFDTFLPLFAKHGLDLLTVHGRTVKEMYRTPVHYDYIAQAVASLPFPVAANGNVFSPDRAMDVLRQTRVQGLMIGRGCIRNPWLFDQIRDHRAGRAVRLPTGRAVLQYVEELYESTRPHEGFDERLQVEKMKKYMNFIGQGVDGQGQFLHAIRRVSTRDGFFGVCRDALDHDSPMPLIPATEGVQ